MICFSFKSLQKVECLFLEDEKIVLTLNTLFIVVSFFDAESSVNDSIDGTVNQEDNVWMRTLTLK